MVFHSGALLTSLTVGKRMILFPQSCPARSTPQCEANLTSTGCAQVDPELRNFLRFWANQSLHNDGPTAAYAFYYCNMPNVPTTRRFALPFTRTVNLV